MAYMKVCNITYCPKETSVRLCDLDNFKRMDLCYGHAFLALKIWDGKVEVADSWNGITREHIESAMEGWRNRYE